MDHSRPKPPNLPTKMEPSGEVNYSDELKFPSTLSSLATSMSDINSTSSQKEKYFVNKSYEIQAEEYKALFSFPAKTIKCNKLFHSQDDISMSPSTGKTPKRDKDTVNELTSILVECMDRINTRSREMLLRKFYAEVEKEERLERFIVERLRKSKVKAIKELCEMIPISVAEEGINENGGDNVSTRSLCENVEEPFNKLARFRVKTFDFGDDVLQDDKK